MTRSLSGVLNNLTVQPVVLNGQSPPRGLHALVSVVGWLVGSALGKLAAVLRIFQEMLRLLHGVLRWDGHGIGPTDDQSVLL